MISVRGLTKSYGGTLAVDDLSFDIHPGLRDRVPRPERLGEIHNDAPAARAR
jgi:ABC-type branched-subunit amino acid transport system ATPase component